MICRLELADAASTGEWLQARVDFHRFIEVEGNVARFAVEKDFLGLLGRWIIRPFMGVHEDHKGVPLTLGVAVRAQEDG